MKKVFVVFAVLAFSLQVVASDFDNQKFVQKERFDAVSAFNFLHGRMNAAMSDPGTKVVLGDRLVSSKKFQLIQEARDAKLALQALQKQQEIKVLRLEELQKALTDMREKDLEEARYLEEARIAKEAAAAREAGKQQLGHLVYKNWRLFKARKAEQSRLKKEEAARLELMRIEEERKLQEQARQEAKRQRRKAKRNRRKIRKAALEKEKEKEEELIKKAQDEAQKDAEEFQGEQTIADIEAQALSMFVDPTSSKLYKNIIFSLGGILVIEDNLDVSSFPLHVKSLQIACECMKKSSMSDYNDVKEGLRKTIDEMLDNDMLKTLSDLGVDPKAHSQLDLILSDLICNCE